MRAPFQKASAPRIRALGGAAARARAHGPAETRAQGAAHGAVQGAAMGAASVLREFVATLEKLDKTRRRRKPGNGEG
ncbi:hypothetical protein V5F53_08085 [Xanthobacter sp. V4C-4]|uniref:hypothetical protein n=1 Tax=Xanthobacter cornucopiae TaxID=3119924 RepID=UPI003729421C